MGTIIFFAVVISFVFLEFITVRRSKGVWRWLALIPAAAMVAIIAIIVVSVIYDPTSHNLWPFEIFLWSAGGIVFLGMLFLVKKIANQGGKA